MSSKPKSFKELFHGCLALRTLSNKAQQHIQIEPLVKKHLPKTLSEKVQVANFREGYLVLGISQDFALELHYETEALLGALQKKLPELKKIEVKVLLG